MTHYGYRSKLLIVPAVRRAGLAGCWLYLMLLAKVLAASTVNWTQFRGPQASGVSDEAAPVTWNVESSENIRWRTPIPGLGHASPIIWRERVYLATAVKPGSWDLAGRLSLGTSPL